MMRPKIISIEGNIGAGKTTILNQIEALLEKSDNHKIVVLKEPVDVWSTIVDKDNQTILQKFYEDPTKYSFPFQILTFNTRLFQIKKTIEKYPDCEILLCERSLEADLNIFAKMLYEDHLIDDISYQIYLKVYNETVMGYNVDQIFYLNIDPNICLYRIKQRDREGEDNIQLEYLDKCKKYHDEWLCKKDLPYEVINTSEPFIIYNYFLEQVKK